MATSIDVAQYIYNKKGWMDAWKLAKLTYYAQAWSLGWFGKPMFAEEFQAWKDGPVEPRLHAENRDYRRGITGTTLPSADISRLEITDIEVIDAVLEFYGDFTKQELIDLTHSERPWIEAREGLPDDARSRNPISQSAMRRFYATQELNGRDVPVRPMIPAQSSPVDINEKIKGAVNRWHSALELLADR